MTEPKQSDRLSAVPHFMITCNSLIISFMNHVLRLIVCTSFILLVPLYYNIYIYTVLGTSYLKQPQVITSKDSLRNSIEDK